MWGSTKPGLWASSDKIRDDVDRMTTTVSETKGCLSDTDGGPG